MLGTPTLGAFYFSLGGDGNVSISGYLTPLGFVRRHRQHIRHPKQPGSGSAHDAGSGWQGVVDPSNALAITGISGTFTDVALGITDQPIESLVTIAPQAHYDQDYTIPYSFGWYPGIPATAVSYDNLFYAGADLR